ncbi:MAG: FMN-binding negative transcriptional regulator [Chloroflexi bacterium]|nr:FMN-binding negative transcriptional regulator [Chloroflexota bacterium]
MYQPAHGRFEVEDPVALLAELVQLGPATLVTFGDGGFETTMLPLLFEAAPGPHGTLFGHVARPNPQWQAADGRPAVAILRGPDAYVSPSWYEEKRRTGRVVPTWNYIVAVAHGSLAVHDDPAWLQSHVRALVDRHEVDRPDPWSVDDAPLGYIAGQAKGIVGLELRIDRIEAKRKLGQNRSAADIEGTIDGLARGSARELEVARAMVEAVGSAAAAAPANVDAAPSMESPTRAAPRADRG